MIRALAWSPDSLLLAQGTSEGLVEIIRVDGPADAVRCKVHDAPILDLDWHPTGERLATVAADGAVKIIEPKQGNELLTFRILDERFAKVAWSPKGKRIAAATDGGKVRIWDSSRGYEFAEGGARQSELAHAYYSLASEVAAQQREGYLRKALELAPKVLDYRHLRGNALAKLDKFDAAARAAFPGAATTDRSERNSRGSGERKCSLGNSGRTSNASPGGGSSDPLCANIR